MAVSVLHYDGQSHKLADGEAEKLSSSFSMMELKEEIRPQFVEVKLKSGATLSVLVSPNIPLALELANEGSSTGKPVTVL